jgi:hypothetical protein
MATDGRLTEREQNILEALKDGPMRGEMLARRAGWRCNSGFRTTLSHLVQRGHICHHKRDGYQLPAPPRLPLDDPALVALGTVVASLLGVRDELVACGDLTLKEWSGRVTESFPFDASVESTWVRYLVELADCRVLRDAAESTGSDPGPGDARAEAASRQAMHSFAGTGYGPRVNEVRWMAMHRDDRHSVERVSKVVVLLLSEEVAAAAKKMVDSRPINRLAFLPFMEPHAERMRKAREGMVALRPFVFTGMACASLAVQAQG